MDKMRRKLLDKYYAVCEKAGTEVKTYHKMVCCGKSTCTVCGGVDYAHGPYVYGFFRDKVSKLQKWVYIGRVPPRAIMDKMAGKQGGAP